MDGRQYGACVGEVCVLCSGAGREVGRVRKSDKRRGYDGRSEQNFKQDG